jgi:subtilisin family serine protease
MGDHVARTGVRARFYASVLASASLVCGLLGPADAADGHDHGPVWKQVRPRVVPVVKSHRVPSRFVVRFDPATPPAAVADARDRAVADGGHAYFTYSHAVVGFAASLTAQALRHLRADHRVVSIEPDMTVGMMSAQPNPPSWGLDRIDQHHLPLDNSYTYFETGAGVTAYVIDTGIRATHRDLLGRVQAGFSTVSDSHGTDDCNGHGTHVAGTLGGTNFGVAKEVKLVPIRVLDCEGSGTISGVIEGVDWVTNHHVGPSVANMSLGGVTSDTLDAAVANSIAHGITYVIAAGNDTGNACTFSPGRVPGTITVGATTRTDAEADYSNSGKCVSLFAPGDEIISDYGTGDNEIATLSGTSMAAPHVAGAVAQYLQQNPDATPSQVDAAIIGLSSLGVLTSLGAGSPNRLLFSVLPELAPRGGESISAGPAIAPPSVVLVPGTVSPSSVTVQVGLGATSGVTAASYQLQRSADGKTWGDVVLPDPTATTLAIAMKPGEPLFVRARAFTASGTAGDWSAAGPVNAVLSGQVQSVAYEPGTAWATAAPAGSLFGGMMSSNTRSATATFTFTGTQIAWVADRGVDLGRAVVEIDGVKIGLVDLYSAHPLQRSILYLNTNLKPGQHTVRISVEHAKNNASTGWNVDVQGWLALG